MSFLPLTPSIKVSLRKNLDFIHYGKRGSCCLSDFSLSHYSVPLRIDITVVTLWEKFEGKMLLQYSN